MENEITMEEKQKESGAESMAPAFPVIQKGRDLTIRDDQHDHAWLLDAAKLCRRQGSRLRLVDSGVLDRYQLEWLFKAGVDFYSSDEARGDFTELENLRLINRRNRMAYFLHGDISPDQGENDGVVSLGRHGIDLHVSSREQAREIPRLSALAGSCRSGRGRLVYYHHGALDSALEDLARAGAWIHLPDVSLKGESEFSPVFDILKAARSAGAGLIVHLDNGLDIPLLEALLAAKALVLFKLGQVDYRSPMKPIEMGAARRKPPAKSFYLYPHFLP